MVVPVIQYHKIDEPGPRYLVKGGFTPPGRFAKQMGYLKRSGFVFYTAADIIEHLQKHGAFPRNGIAITFDDGWKDNYTNAFPILRQMGIKATIFLVASCIGQISAKALAAGESGREHLSREEILEMAAQGVEFGSHTVNHKLLDQLAPEEVKFEVEESKRQIENLLQEPCKTFAYPAGRYSPAAQRIIANAGHIAAFSTTYGPSDHLDLFALNRVEILRRDHFQFQLAAKVRPLRSSASSY